jgi:hypothetical protein
MYWGRAVDDARVAILRLGPYHSYSPARLAPASLVSAAPETPVAFGVGHDG